MCEECWACCLVMNCGMLLCHVNAVVFFAWGFSVAEQMDDVVVDDSKRSGVVRLHWSRRLGMTHEFEGMADEDGFSAVDVESPHLSLCHQGYDRLDDMCNCEDGAIVWWFGSLLDMKKCLPTRLHAFDLERYDALLCPARTMSLTWYVTIASGRVKA
jgi:hypothetical protein